MRIALKGLGKPTALVIPACCWAIIPGAWPYSALDVPVFMAAFETTGSTISGLKAAYRRRGMNDVCVVGWAGDGGTYDIGIQALSGAAERNEDVLYVCYDNEAYMNTGVQRSGGTPYGAWTTTTPGASAKLEPKKDIDEIMIAHRIPYIATATPAYPHDMVAKFKKARSIRGMRFIRILAACPAGWRTPDNLSVEIMRKAVQCNTFPLFEVEDGSRFHQTVTPDEVLPVDNYLKMQGRFKQMTDDDIQQYQAETDERFERFRARFEG
jgi:pyruvate/2-oxoacid:ferredoxin oxidoreductase beta subunit